MKNKIHTHFLVLITLLITSCATPPNISPDATVYAERLPAQSFASSCIESIRSLFRAKKTSRQPNMGSFRYPLGFTDIDNSQIQYGFESEYLRNESQGLLKNYMPKIFPDRSIWVKMTHEERLSFMNVNAEKIFKYRQKGELIKIAENKELNDVLPDSFIYDSGNYEIILDPVDTAEELIHKIKIINKNFGIGSMQATISNPLNKVLLGKNAVYVQEMKQETFGYYNYINDMDTLNKLSSGYERFLQNNNVESAKSFDHPWLGPMTKLKRDRLEGLIASIFDLNPISPENLKAMASQVVSHKFTGGLTFRPDVAYSKGRIASEIRDCHQNTKCLEERIIRETYFLMQGKKNFSKFKDLKAFDSIKTYSEKFSPQIKLMLEGYFPIYGAYTQQELQRYRNFAYPLRDWSMHIQMLGKPELAKKVADAQAEYIDKLQAISKNYPNHYTEKEGKVLVMAALTEFAKKSGLSDAMNDHYKTLIDEKELEKLKDLKLTIFLQNYYLMMNMKVA